MSTAFPIIHIVDDDVTFRIAIGRLLRAAGYQVALHGSGVELLDSPLGNQPGCILLDVRMPCLSGLELQKRLSEMNWTIPIVFLTGHGDIASSVKAIKAGADDFLSKPISRKALLEAVARALVRDALQREQDEELGRLRSRLAALTPRERQVFALVVRGKLSKQIAHELGTTERTIKAHRRAMMEKLEVGSLAEAVSLAERLSLVPHGGSGTL